MNAHAEKNVGNGFIRSARFFEAFSYPQEKRQKRNASMIHEIFLYSKALFYDKMEEMTQKEWYGAVFEAFARGRAE